MKHAIMLLVLLVGFLMSIGAGAASTDAVVTEGVVNAPVAEVWRMWTTKDGIESWMVAKTEIDLRVGGAFRTSYSKTSTLDDDASIHHIILAFDPLKMFAMHTVKPPKNFPYPNAILKAWTVVYFEPLGESKTKVTAHMLGFTDDEESQKMRVFFEAGNKTTLDALIKKFEPR